MADPIAPVGAATQSTTTAQTATNAFGLGFESLLKIILTQLTYQDPLKPMDNFQFVSQLAQFSQIQQGQTISESLAKLVSAQAASQATALLGQKVDIDAGSAIISGTVKAVSLLNGDPKITIENTSGQTISNLSVTAITEIRQGA